MRFGGTHRGGEGGVVVSLPSVKHWADAIIGLDASGPLPARVALVPSEAFAHALRVALIARAPSALIGTRFLTAPAAARAVLDEAGVVYTLGEELRRPLRLRKLFRAPPPLTTYHAEDLASRGWEEAFASTFEELEAAALRPEDLERLGDPRANDLATVWRAIDDDAQTSWTIHRVMAEAASVLARDATAWPFEAPVLASISIGIDAVHARFLREIPRITSGVVPGRPARRRALERARSLLGDDVASALAVIPRNDHSETELDLLHELLFEGPERLGAPGRARSRGPDGTVAFELHAGVDEELDATARWVAEEVFEHGTPLQDLAILVPTPDPLSTLIADRVLALPWPPESSPVYLASGRPTVSTTSGARLLAVLTALEQFLPSHAMLELLPRLRLAGRDGRASPKDARKLITALGARGGSVARPDDALRWRDRLASVELDVRLRALGPAVLALVGVAAEMLGGASLDQLWKQLLSFVSTHLIGSHDMEEIIEELDELVSELAADRAADGIAGRDAIELIADQLRSMRRHESRYGAPAIYVGTVASAAGLPFSSVRVVGLVESAFPGTLREDGNVPASLRRRLPSMASDDDYATGRLHTFDQVVRGTRHRLVLSAPRTDLDGSEREPAALFVEAAAALGRPNAVTGLHGAAIPTASDLERDAFEVARTNQATALFATPLSPLCWLRRVARDRDVRPSTCSRDVVTDPIAALAKSSAMSGLLGPEPLVTGRLGTSSDQPLSASALRTLLACPQRFLLERILGFWPRQELPEAHRIDAAAYGTLFHNIVESFLREHGAAFGARREHLAYWTGIAEAMADRAFSLFVESSALLGDGVIQGERRRLLRNVLTFIQDDWGGGRPRTFVATEREFGDAARPVAIPTSTGLLYLRGRIDRIDVEDGVTLVRDLKTGRARPRDATDDGPKVDVDLQLAVYVAVVGELAAELSLPAEIAAAYTYVDDVSAVRERAFRTDRHVLRAAGQRWFDLASALVREQTFVQTPDGDDCRWCPFAAVCGDDSSATAARLANAQGSLATFRDLKG